MAVPTILILDDDEPTAELVRIACEKAMRGAELVVTHRVSEAVTFLRQASQPPSLVLIDLLLSNESGLALVDFIRVDRKMATVPVVVMSGRGSPVDVDKALRLGANAFVFKPGSLEELLELVEALRLIWVPQVAKG